MPIIGTKSKSLTKDLAICLILAGIIAAAYAPVARHGFIDFDDPVYVTQNRHVLKGLTWEGVTWAFTAQYGANWHPVTWLSHMADVRLFGLNAGGHHLVNVALHITNALLLYLLFQKMSGARYRSAVVAALFALHPLHVESVAWVAERKDLLSTFFGLLSLMIYSAYAKPDAMGLGNRNRLPAIWYALSLVTFCLSLMSKPMLVTLPFLLLLLDYWPLGRAGLGRTIGRAAFPRRWFTEKIPFFALAALSCVITYSAQKAGSAVITMESLPIGSRIENALTAYAGYLAKIFWPLHLAVPYLLPDAWSITQVLFAGVLLVILSATAVLFSRSKPYLITGWFWFLGTLVPVIGLVQVGSQASADRYTYVPAIGIFIAVVWLVSEVVMQMKSGRLWLGAAATAALVACLSLTRLQIGYWVDTQTLFRHTLVLMPENYYAHELLGNVFLREGKMTEARSEFEAALKIKPGFASSLSSLAKLDYGQGQFDGAAKLLAQVVELYPRDPVAHSDLALALNRVGRVQEAISHHLLATQIDPDNPDLLNNFAWLLATSPQPGIRNGTNAVRMAEHACELTDHSNLWMLSTLAAAYAEAGRFSDAVRVQQQVCQLAVNSGQSNRIVALQERIELYRSGNAFHSP